MELGSRRHLPSPGKGWGCPRPPSPPCPSHCYRHGNITHRTWLCPALAVSPRRTGKKPSGLPGILPPGPCGLRSSPSSWLPLWTCLTPSSGPARPGLAMPAGCPRGLPAPRQHPVQPTPCFGRSRGGEGSKQQAGAELGRGARPAPTPAACGLGTVSVMGLSFIKWHSSQRRLETRTVEAGDQRRGFGF